MAQYEASFKIDAKSDLYAAQRILDEVYDSIREESQTIREGANDAEELLRAFQGVRDAAKQPTAGKLTVTYEQYDDTLEG